MVDSATSLLDRAEEDRTFKGPHSIGRDHGGLRASGWKPFRK
jgi:hypothetical protein